MSATRTSTRQVAQSGSFPSTPRQRFITKRAKAASFQDLVALANHQERLKKAKEIVWRDKGEAIVEIDTLQQCLAHAISGGFSEFYAIHVYFYFTFHVFTLRIRCSCVQYTRFSQCYTCPNSYSSYPEVGSHLHSEMSNLLNLLNHPEIIVLP